MVKSDTSIYFQHFQPIGLNLASFFANTDHLHSVCCCENGKSIPIHAERLLANELRNYLE